MTGALSRYAFAADEDYSRTLMRRYAGQFKRGPVVDLGSGRGHFLEALRERGVAGYGVDISEEALEFGRRQGFDVIHDDAIHFLGDARDLAGIFAAHLIEHLPPDQAEELIRRAAAALAPNGTITVVTPNIADYGTWTELFWLDTTHIRPYPARLIAALMERHGLVVDESGRAHTPQGRRAIPRVLLGRLRFGVNYGSTEVFVRAHRP